MLLSSPARARFLTALVAVLALVAPILLSAAPAQAAVKKPLDIVTIYYNPPGADHARNSLRTKEYIRVKNTSSSTLNLTGYTIRDSGPWKFTFAKGTKLKRGKTLTIRSGIGKTSSTTQYWGAPSYIWNNTGDTARLYNSKGKLLESCRYKGKRTKATKTYVRSTATTAYC
ncbi:lamin tail domain-containing protein [Brevibacterium senegalense]|uniref:lamin tail domain-containing protein n=1 Tax=Brevibacterium senegalense TaxID=1033736 RepID=UPI00030AE68E|nr:lamin tail domain-containing protein [Brevibacterium senegalense]